MSCEPLPLSDFEKNLNFTSLKLKDEDLGDYWLNKDGTYKSKKSWLSRLVRWIQNWLHDRTLRDIWHVFKKSIEDYDFSRDFPTGGFDYAAESTIFINERRERLEFAAKFLFSRKKKFDRWAKKNKSRLQTIKKYLTKYQGSFPDSDIDQVPSRGHIVSKLEQLYIPKLNPKNLGKKPPPVTFSITPEKNKKEYDACKIKELPGRLKGVSFSANGSHSKDELVAKLTILCTVVEGRDPNVSGIGAAIQPVYYDQLELLLKNILYEIKFNNAIKTGKKNLVLTELAEGATWCPPRWLEEANRQHRNLITNHGEALVLTYVQDFKETVISDAVRKEFRTGDGEDLEFHFLNTFRLKFGEQFALDTTTCKLDVYSYPAPPRIFEKMKLTFLEMIEAPKMVKGIKERINAETGTTLPEYLLQCVEKKEKLSREKAVNFTYDNFYDDDCYITDDGVIFLLQQPGILN